MRQTSPWPRLHASGSDRMYRIRRPASPHHAAATSLRSRPRMDQRRGVPRRRRSHKSASRTCIHPVGDLLRMAAAPFGRRDRRRLVLHRPRADSDPWLVGAVLERPSAAGRSWRGGRRWGRRGSSRCSGRGKPRPGELEASAPAQAAPAVDHLRGSRSERGNRLGSVRGSDADRCWHSRDTHPAGHYPEIR